MVQFKIKVCLKCGQEYTPTSASQKWCTDCGALMRKEYLHQWFGVRPGYQTAHQDYDVNLARSRAYGVAHKEERDIYSQTHYAAHKNEYVQRAHKRRKLGFIPLNQSLDGYEAHHLDHDHVVYIPRELHRSVFHRQRDGRGMAEINALAYEWLTKNTDTPAK